METKKITQWNGPSRHAVVAKSEVVILHAKRDMELISVFGISEEFIENFEAKVNNLESLPVYGQILADQVAETEKKEEAKLVLIQNLQKQRRIFAMLFPFGTMEYNHNMKGNLHSMKFEAFKSRVKTMIARFEKYLTELSEFGMTQETIDSLKADFANYLALGTTKTAGKDNGDNSTEDTYAVINDVYSDLKRICDAGKALWIDESPARYKDYVISR